MAMIDSITLGNLCIIEVDADPTVSGVTANIGDFAMIGSGAGGCWRKYGAGDTDWSEMTDNDLLRAKSTKNHVFVDKTGDDTSGDGTKHFPYLTIAAATTYIATQTPSAANPYKIIVGSGVFAEAPISIESHVSVQGQGFRQTIIVPTNQNADLMTLADDVTISAFTLSGQANPSFHHLRLSGTSDAACIVTNMAISGGVNGIIATSTVADFKPVISNCGLTNLAGIVISVGQNCTSNILACRFIGNGTTTVGIQTNDDAITNIDGGTMTDCNICCYQLSTGETSITDTDLRNNIIPMVKLNNSAVLLKGTAAVLSKALIGEVEGMSGYSLDTTNEGQSIRIFDELSVGIPGQGKESIFGEGDSYVNGMLVYSYDGSTYTDITTEAASKEGSTFAFPNTAINSAIYVSTQRLTAGTTDPLQWFGIKHSCITAAVGGEIVVEYWDGSSWVEFNHMSTDSSGGYYPHGKEIFKRVGSDQIRFNSNIADDWALNDPTSIGTNYHWARFRTVSTLTTAPVFEQFKVHSNRTEINADGFVEYFGIGKPLNILPIDAGAFNAANSSPQNQDVYFGDNLAVGRIENRFEANTVDRVGFVNPLPQDLDTSEPIKLILHFVSDEPNSGGEEVDFVVRWSNSNDGDRVYGSTQSPTVAPREQSISQSVSFPAVEWTQFSFEFEMDVSDFLTRTASGGGDLFWCTIQRNNDGNSAWMVLIQVEIQYTKWCNGGHRG